MPTKTTKKQPDSTVVRLYMAEDFREEKDGKISAICLFPDWNILLHIPQDHPNPTTENPAALRSLCFLFSVTGAPAGASVSIDLQLPSEKRNVVPPQNLPANNLPSNFIIRNEPCLIAELGKRTFIFTVNQREYKFDWQFGRKDIPTSMIEPVSTPAKASPKRKAKK